MFCSRHDLYIEKNNGGFKGLERNNTSIAANPTGRVVILVMMYVDTFKTAIPAFHRKSHNMLDVILIDNFQYHNIIRREHMKMSKLSINIYNIIFVAFYPPKTTACKKLREIANDNFK